MNDNRMTAQERRVTWGAGAIFSLRMLGMFMVLPVLTTYGMALSDATPTLIGIAIGIYGITQALLQIPFGLASDRFGRIPLIVFGLGIFVIGSVIAALSHSIFGVIIGRALQGAGAISSAIMALISDTTREQNRTKAMAFIGISFGLTFAAAMVFGPIITHHWGLHALFWVIALFASLGLVLALFVLPKSTHQTLNRESNIVRSDLLNVLKNAQLLKLNVSIFSLHTLLMASFIALPQVMESMGILRDKQWQVYLFTMLIAFVCVVPFIIYAEKKRRMKQVFLLCISFLTLAELLFYLVNQHSLVGLLIAIQLFFIGFNILEAILPSWISKEAPAGYRGTAMGTYATSQFLGTAFGGMIGGFLYDFAAANAVFIAGFGFAALWFFISATMKQPPYVSSLRFELPTLSADQLVTLETKLKQLAGITDVVVMTKENAAYIKIDRQKISREQVETALVNPIV